MYKSKDRQRYFLILTLSKANLDFSLTSVMNKKQSRLNHYQHNPLPFNVLNTLHSFKKTFSKLWLKQLNSAYCSVHLEANI